MIPVVLSGGAGTRLWPVSRKNFPKQFCNIFDQSLISMTLERLKKFGPPHVITSEYLHELTTKILTDLKIDPNQIVLEPSAKNTAPAIALITAIYFHKGLQEEIIGIFPADHIIEDEIAFKNAIEIAEEDAKKGKVATLGITPDHAATGYGYIQTLNATSIGHEKLQSYPVLAFHEKPDINSAKKYLKSGNHFWNAGIFIFKVSTMIELFKTHKPEMWNLFSNIDSNLSNLSQVYANIESISLDFAIIEKISSSGLTCVPSDIGWNDVGSWDSIANILSRNLNNNFIEHNGSHNFVHSTKQKNYTFVGVSELIVVDTEDALLITKKGATQGVKEAVELIKSQNPQILLSH